MNPSNLSFPCSTHVKDSEALGYSMIVRKLLLFHKASTELTALPGDSFSSLLQQMYALTLKFIECSANEEAVSFSLGIKLTGKYNKNLFYSYVLKILYI